MKLIEVNENNFKKEVLDAKKVLVDFNAMWCGPCRMLNPILEEFSEKKIIKVLSCDVDKNENLAMKYGISSIPCLIVLENGVEMKRHIGFMNMNELEEFVGDEDV